MSQRYPIPADRHRVDETRDRSRFITTVGRATSDREAKAFIAEVSAEFPDADIGMFDIGIHAQVTDTLGYEMSILPAKIEYRYLVFKRHVQYFLAKTL